ncbi:MAG: hypothetical protein AAB964_00540, partial [Patescibacteria group bacterium]
MKKILFALAIAGGLGAASVAFANHAWGEYHWARTTPTFTLALGDNVSGAWDSYLAQASTDWNASSIVDTAVVPGTTNKSWGLYTPKRCHPATGRGEVCSAKYGSTGWLGVASIWISGSHITAGTVKMNDSYFNTATYNKPAWRALVMCQEIGHIFGLDHQDEAFNNANLGTCMDYTSSPDTNQHPNAHDYEMLETIYAHLDTTTTVAQSAATLPQDSNEPDEWGREVRRSRDGRASVFVQELDGTTVVRH